MTSEEKNRSEIATIPFFFFLQFTLSSECYWVNSSNLARRRILTLKVCNWMCYTWNRYFSLLELAFLFENILHFNPVSCLFNIFLISQILLKYQAYAPTYTKANLLNHKNMCLCDRCLLCLFIAWIPLIYFSLCYDICIISIAAASFLEIFIIFLTAESIGVATNNVLTICVPLREAYCLPLCICFFISVYKYKGTPIFVGNFGRHVIPI